MTSTPKSDKPGSEGGRPGNRLARRARSFKEDLLDILYQMRSPNSSSTGGGGAGNNSGGVGVGGGGGNASGTGSPKPPRSPKPRNVSASDMPSSTDDRNPLADLDLHVKQVQLALKHFNDVVSKNKLEVLPGNGTIVLESIATIQSVLKTYVFIDQSSALMSATNQVYQSLTILIKLCDDVLIGCEKGLNKENVTEVLQQVDDAVQNLLDVVRAKLVEDNSKTQQDRNNRANNQAKQNYRWDPGPLRSSLPDIPVAAAAAAVAVASIPPVVDAVDGGRVLPPAKPPMPFTKVWLGDSPPPLPPKKKSTVGSGGAPSQSMEQLSIRSDNSSLGSLDSILNTSSKDEEELRGIMDEESARQDHHSALIVNGSQTSSCCWDNSSCSTSDHTHLTESPDPTPTLNNNSIAGCNNSILHERSSFSSGYLSMQHSSSSHQSSFNYSATAASQIASSSFSTSSEERRFTSKSCSTFASASSESSVSSSVSQTTATTSGPPTATAIERRGSSVSASFDSVPPLPEKKRSRRERQPSQYDNVPSTTTLSSSPPDSKPPPLPLKKKHIMAYMEMFGNCSQPSATDLLRHSVHTYSLLQAEWQQQQQHQTSLTSTQSCSFSSHSFSASHSRGGTGGSMDEFLRGGSPDSSFLTTSSLPISPNRSAGSSPGAGVTPPALPPKRGRVISSSPPPPPPPMASPSSASPQTAPLAAIEPPPSPSPVMEELESENEVVTNGGLNEPNVLFELEVSKYLVMMRPEDGEGVAIRGGPKDALIIQATKASKNEDKQADFLYQEAFLTTYRTFLSPQELIEKLCVRQQKFSGNIDPAKQRAAREAFSLLVRVVSDLTVSDLEDSVLKMLMDFVYKLLSGGDLTMARVLRVVILDKYNLKRQYYSTNTLLPSQNIYTRQSSLVDFKSDHVAEQMTLLDSELFMKIEIPEVLIWAQEQNEERSPNLTRFTEHFNKMSYWARSRILEQSDAKERERYVVKFIKIMKHLRKINNFNSYLALLSALDSAPIRRLEWQKHITEGLKEYCALIDSSSSFRAYRQALAETQPPCIPYIGLVLQDLTFVHIGNSDLLSEGVINFSKRWQQFNIVENMKRFKKGTYNFKKNERIIAFFSNFDDFLCEEAMWQISESIKPRGTKKTNQ